MILGVGMDLVDLASFREQLALPGSAFVEGVFTAAERRACRCKPSGDPAQHLAARFAAKEAFIKAWSSARYGLPPDRLSTVLTEIEVVQDAWGRPRLRLHGDVASVIEPRGWTTHVSLTHDGGYCAATVLLSST